MVEAVLDEKVCNWLSNKNTIMVPCDRFKCEMTNLIVPLLINEVGRNSDEGVLAAFVSPHVVDQTKARTIVLIIKYNDDIRSERE